VIPVAPRLVKAAQPQIELVPTVIGAIVAAHRVTHAPADTE
jgi:hypothetical protein